MEHMFKFTRSITFEHDLETSISVEGKIVKRYSKGHMSKNTKTKMLNMFKINIWSFSMTRS